MPSPHTTIQNSHPFSNLHTFLKEWLVRAAPGANSGNKTPTPLVLLLYEGNCCGSMPGCAVVMQRTGHSGRQQGSGTLRNSTGLCKRSIFSSSVRTSFWDLQPMNRPSPERWQPISKPVLGYRQPLTDHFLHLPWDCPLASTTVRVNSLG